MKPEMSSSDRTVMQQEERSKRKVLQQMKEALLKQQEEKLNRDCTLFGALNIRGVPSALASTNLTQEQNVPYIQKRNALLYVMHGFLILTWTVQPCGKRKEAGDVEQQKDGHAAGGAQQKEGSAAAEGGPSEAAGGELQVSIAWK
ncbi:hypothetical protein RHSIM_Rhsim07G0184900 [Rhododendron simsii]|uniref:Uncharacterized protein n=1 Tax=Rhododendron simsii TaxID=118357 RepID=A0A834GP17_RHOSS|nr:hypothetical protein RHSIM_Rhsim07G0184900 [Rhododendron simsii]